MIYSKILIVLILACSTTLAQYQSESEDKTKTDSGSNKFVFGTEHNPKNKISIDVGYTYRLNKLHSSLNSYEKDYQQKLRSGISYDVSLTHYFNAKLGVGLKLNHFSSNGSLSNILIQDIDGSGRGIDAILNISDKINISYLGPVFSVRFWDLNSKSYFYVNASLGYQRFSQNRLSLYEPNTGQNTSHSLHITGHTIGASTTAGIDRFITPSLVLGLKVDLISGVLKSIKEGDRVIDLSKNNYEGLHRITFGGGVRYIF